MLHRVCGKTRRGKIRNDNIKESVGVASLVEKVIKNRLRLFEHVERRPLNFMERRVDEMERGQIVRGRRRPRKL